MIAWETHSGEDVERAIATYICLENSTAIRIRPSQGDGGIDVIKTLDDGKIAVYQIKKFATNLSAGQKEQIKKSWETILAYARNERLELCEWFLVMPLDPTNENRKWFNELTCNQGITAQWLGRTHIDGWAAKMPYVGDYYFCGNRNSLMDTAKTLLDATRSDITSEKGLIQQIESIRQILCDLNPHYFFDFKVVDAIMEEEPFNLKRRPGTVMSTIERIDDHHAIQIDIVAKHVAATELSPIEGKVKIYIENEQQRVAVQDFIDYGIPICNLPASITETSIPSFLSSRDFEKGLISMGERPTGKVISVSVTNGTGDFMDIRQQSFNQGMKGVAWKGSADDDSLSISMKANVVDKTCTVAITCNLNFIHSSTLADVRRRLRFFLKGEENGFSVNIGSSEVARFSMDSIEMNKTQIRDLYQIAGLLVIVDMESASAITFPRELSGDELSELIFIANVIQKETVTRKWSKLWLEDSDNELTEGIYRITSISALTLHMMKRQHACGYIKQEFVGIWNKEQESFFPTDSYGDNITITYLGSNNNTGFEENRFYFSSIMSKSK